MTNKPFLPTLQSAITGVISENLYGSSSMGCLVLIDNEPSEKSIPGRSLLIGFALLASGRSDKSFGFSNFTYLSSRKGLWPGAWPKAVH